MAEQNPTQKDPVHAIEIDGENWYVRKIDSTHFYMANNRKALEHDSPSHVNGALARHIGQFRGEPYYDELRGWLKNG